MYSMRLIRSWYRCVGSPLVVTSLLTVLVEILVARPVDACCPWQIKSVVAPNVQRCKEATATIELTCQASEDVLIEVRLYAPQDDPLNPHPDPPPPGDAIFPNAPSNCGQWHHKILVCIPQYQTSAGVTYRGTEATDEGYPMKLEACVATSECEEMEECDGTCNPTNCGSAMFQVTPTTYDISIDWTDNPSNMISVNADYNESNPDHKRDNEGALKIVSGDEELKTIELDITGTSGWKGRWRLTGASDVELWKSPSEHVAMGQDSPEITIPYSTTLIMEGISPSGDLDATTLTATFTPSIPCDGPVSDAMSFTVVKAEIDNRITPDEYEDKDPGEPFCLNDDYDEGGPYQDYLDFDPLHQSEGELVLEEMRQPTLTVQPATEDFLPEITVNLTGARNILRVFGVHAVDEGPDEYEIIDSSEDISDYFGEGANSDWTIVFEGIAETGTEDLSLIVMAGDDVVAQDTVRYSIGHMTVSPTAGEIGTVITIKACPACAAEFNDDTSVTFTGTFEPEGYPPTAEFTVSYLASKVFFDPDRPDELKIILGDALPGGDFWTNPGVLARVEGRLVGTLEAASCSTGVSFTVQPSVYQIGYDLLGGDLEPQTELLALPINDSTDVSYMADPSGDGSYIARFIVTINESPPAGTSAPNTRSATIRTRAGGQLVSEGVTTTFDLHSASSTMYEYRSSKMILFNESTAVEGEFPEAVVVRASEQGASVEIIVQP